MTGLNQEELEELRKALHKFDGGLLQMEYTAGSYDEIGAVLKEIRRNTPYSWNMRDCSRPSDLVVTFLDEGTINAGKVQEELAELIENEAFIVNGKNEELPDHLKERFSFSKWNDKNLDFFEALDSAITNAQDAREIFANVREYFNVGKTKDSAYQFMYACMNRDEHILLDKIVDTLDPTIEILDKTIKEAEEVQKARLNSILDKADAKNEELVSYLKEHEGAFDMMNLKLHDASSYEYRDMKKDFPTVYEANEGGYYGSDSSAFYQFCNDTYDQFTDWLAEEKINWKEMQHQVGRTSSFYLHDEGNFIALSRRDYSIDVPTTLGCITDKLGYSYESVQYKEDGKIDREYTLEDYPNNINDLLMIASGEMLEDVKKELADVIKVYDYIKDTKEHQVEYFKEWLENEEEQVKEDMEVEKE